MRILSSILFTAFLFYSFAGEAQVLSGKREAVKLSDQEKADLVKWNSRFITDLGRIAGATPLRQSEDLSFVQKNLEQIITTLAGERLKKEGKQVIVHVYSSAIPNAFVHRAEPNNILSKLYPNIKLNKPIYEIGFTYALWKNLKTIDEAAFVLAHELTHLFEGHADGKESAHDEDEESRFKEWFSGHRLESIADYMALQMMVGKYNIEAGVRALWMLSQRSSAEFTGDDHIMMIIEELFSSHPSEALRISMAQFNAEHLVRTEKLAAPRSEVAINGSDALKYRAKKDGPTLSSRDQVQSRESVMKDAEILWEEVVSKKKFLNIETLDRDVKEQLGGQKREARPYRADYIEAQKFLIQKVNASKMSPGEKGNALLDIFSFYDDGARRVVEKKAYLGKDLFIENQPYRELWAPVLLKAVRAGWTAKDLYDHRVRGFTEDSEKSGGSEEDLKERMSIYLLEVFDTNENDVMNTLLKYPDIQKIYKDFQLLTYIENGKINFENIFTSFGNLNSHDDIEVNTRDRLFHEVFSSLINSPDIKEEYIRRAIENPHTTFVDLGRVSKVRRKFPQYTEFRQWAFNEFNTLKTNYIRDIKNGDLDHSKIQFVIQTLEYLRHSPEEKKEISNILMKAAEISFQQSYLSGSTFDKVHLFKAASQGQFSKKQRLTLMSYLASQYLTGIASGSREDIITKQMLADVSPKEMLALLEQEWPSFDSGLQDFDKREDLKIALDKLESLNIHEMKNDDIFDFLYYNHNGLRSKIEDLIRDKLEHMLDVKFRAASNWLLFINSVDRFDQLPKGTLTRVLNVLNSRLPQKYIRKKYPLAMKALDIEDKKISDMRIDIGVVSGLFKIHAATGPDDLKEWVSDLEKIHKINSVALDSIPELKQRLELVFLKLAKKEPSLAYQYLTKKSVRALLTAEAFVSVIMPEFKVRVSQSKDAKNLALAIQNIDKELKLKKQLPDVFSTLRDEVAVKYKAQPHTVETILPNDQLKINTKTTSEFDREIRGMSAFAALSSSMEIQDIIEVVEYMMGRGNKIPKTIEKWNDRFSFPISDLLRSIRIRLARENIIVKSFVINSMFAGPKGAMESKEGREAILNHLFKDIKSNKKIIRELFESLLESQPYYKTLPIAYILAQGSSGQKLTEGDLIRASFEAFGAAGIKLGQYLAFTGEFAEYRTALSTLQDSAMPLTYLQMVRLLESRYGKDWNSKIQVIKTLGSGSVNIAVEVYNRSTRKNEVISVLRKDIEISAKEDFRKLDLFIKKFIERSGSNQYQYLLGLIKIIEGSVELEFNKANAFHIQKEATRLYKFQSEGWNYQSVVPHSLDNGAIRMAKAPGKTAKHFRENNPAVYKQVMAGFLRTELDILLGTHPTLKDAVFIANPDVHDGQILIDEKTKTVSVLDFGQALKISPQERLLALELLMMLEMSRDQASFNKYLARLDPSYIGNKKPSQSEIDQFLKRTDRMDRFIYLMGILKTNGAELPMSTIHWILGMNRAIKLGENIGVDIESTLKKALIANRLGASLEVFNQVRSVLLKAKEALQFIKNLPHDIESAVAPVCRKLFSK